MTVSRTMLASLSVFISACTGTAGATVHAAEGATREYIWLEGEQPTFANVEMQRSGWGNAQYLSAGKWLHCSLDADKVDTVVPAEGVLLRYEFEAPRETG